jgi:hypothetical protein
LIIRHGELRKIALYVFLKEFRPELEVLHRMIIREDRVEVSDEVLSIELDHVIVEVNLRENLQVGIQVKLDVCHRRFKKKLHESRISFEVGCRLHEIIEAQ